MLDINVTSVKDTTVVAIDGEIDGNTAPKARSRSWRWCSRAARSSWI